MSEIRFKEKQLKCKQETIDYAMHFLAIPI